MDMRLSAVHFLPHPVSPKHVFWFLMPSCISMHSVATGEGREQEGVEVHHRARD